MKNCIKYKYILKFFNKFSRNIQNFHVFFQSKLLRYYLYLKIIKLKAFLIFNF
jgi:hypothetical protein